MDSCPDKAATKKSCNNVRLLDITVAYDPEGNLAFLQHPGCCPFHPKRVFYIVDVPLTSKRGRHAHRTEEQLMICVSGSFSVDIFDGKQTRTYRLDNPYTALYIPPMVWRTMYDFSPGAVCLVLSSTNYDETDYIRCYDDFLSLCDSNKSPKIK